jgi:hypothetical protein
MLTLRRLQNTDGINDVAKLLGFKQSALSHILYVGLSRCAADSRPA